MQKILGEKLFRTWEFPRSGSKAKNGEEREKERLNNGDNNGQAMHGARKHAWRTQAAWAKSFLFNYGQEQAMSSTLNILIPTEPIYILLSFICYPTVCPKKMSQVISL